MILKVIYLNYFEIEKLTTEFANGPPILMIHLIEIYESIAFSALLYLPSETKRYDGMCHF